MREKAAARGALLTPMAKAFSTDIGNEVAGIGVRAGGMGFMEKPAQRNTFAMRASSPSMGNLPGVQSNDLLMRKLQMSGGEAVWDLLAELKEVVSKVEASNDPSVQTRGEAARCRARFRRTQQQNEGIATSPLEHQPVRHLICGCSPPRSAAARWQGSAGGTR